MPAQEQNKGKFMSDSSTVQFSQRLPNPNFAGVEDVLPEEVRDKKTQLHLVDVRRPDEWVGEYGHIPGAELMTLDTLPDRVDELPKDKTIVFICRSGARSAQAAAFAKRSGYEQVFNMKGGMIAWTEKAFEAEEKNAN
jgi:rhodanese-related sulfurtransferase